MVEKKRNPRFYDDNPVWVLPDENEIMCKDCYLREKDRKIGNTVIKGATLGICVAFKVKPQEILNGEDCPYYIDENEDE